MMATPQQLRGQQRILHRLMTNPGASPSETGASNRTARNRATPCQSPEAILSQAPAVRRNPFTLNPLPMGTVPWTKHQRQAIKASFSADRQKKDGQRIETFTRQAALLLQLGDHKSVESQLTIADKLESVQLAASDLLKALSRVSQSKGLDYLLSAIDAALPRLPSEAGPVPRGFERTDAARELAEFVWGCGVQAMTEFSKGEWTQSLMLRRLWTYASVMQLAAFHSRIGLSPSRGARGKDRRARTLAELLYQTWYFVFGGEPKVNRDGEFHHVVAAVGDAVGVRIGRRLLTESLRGYAGHLNLKADSRS
jgi:hypothetical protein